MAENERNQLDSTANQYKKARESGNDASGLYKKARELLIKAIGIKTAVYILQKQIDTLTPEQIEKKEADWSRWEKYCSAKENKTLIVQSDYYYEPSASEMLTQKIKDLRKELKLNQREFAKQIGVNINLYAEMERGREDIPDDASGLIKNICDAVYANPYWLSDNSADAVSADPQRTARTAAEAKDNRDEYPMFAEASVIRWWWIHQPADVKRRIQKYGWRGTEGKM